MSYAELPVTGYLDRFSRRPGETFTAFVSSRDGRDVRVRLVKVSGGDPNPAGPGIALNPVDGLDLTVPGQRQPIHLGSYGVVENVPAGDPDAARTLTALICPGVVDRDQAILSVGNYPQGRWRSQRPGHDDPIAPAPPQSYPSLGRPTATRGTSSQRASVRPA